ncbi:MAG TPA: large conductance mechanosensitive channel protein MscL [Polyangia bacterium]|nr:large conductance mechanosensitive channel protein MscL [Polyangia bacterium]
MKKLLSEFKEFINKGNIIDLAVAFVIGAAFSKIVSALVGDLIMPLVGAIQPSTEWRTWTVTSLHFKIGDFLGAVLDFLIIALVVFLVMIKMLGRFRSAPSTKPCSECLTDIPLLAKRCKACAAVVATLLLLLCSGSAFAGDPKFEYKDIPEKPPEPKWVLKANASLGLTWAAGNSQALGFSGSALFSAKRYNNQMEFFGSGAYISSGTSKYGPGGPVTDHVPSTQMWLARGRYDRYFLERNTVFAAFQVSGDKPAGYWYRLEPQVGYSRLFFKSVHQLFRGEAGYDYTFEHRVHDFDQIGNVEYHSLRAYLFYENKFTKYAGFTEGFEVLWAMNDIESVRINSLSSLSSQLYKNISLKLNFTVKFNNKPPLRSEKLIDVDDAAMRPYIVTHPNDATLDKVDTLLEAVVAITFL